MATLNVQNYGAVGDGSNDDTQAIQDAINDASNGDSVYFPSPDAYYKIKLPDPATDNGPVLVIDGDTEPDNLTLEGDGESSLIRLGTGHENNHQMLRVAVNGGIKGLEIRDLVFDGDKANQPQAPGVGHGILMRYADSGLSASEIDILVENVLVKRAAGEGILAGQANTVVRNCTADNCGHHGFASAVREGPSNPASKFKNCLVKNCTTTGFYGIDVSTGANTVVEDFVAKNNRQATKTTDTTEEAVYRRFRVSGTDAAGIQRPNPGSDTVSHPITLEDVVIQDTTNYSIRAVAADDWILVDNSDLVINNCAPNRKLDAWFTENVTLSAGNATVSITNSQADSDYLEWSSNENGTIDTLEASNNTGGLDNNGNLTINNQGSNPKTDIDSVPIADEVGAFTSTSSSGSVSESTNTRLNFNSTSTEKGGRRLAKTDFSEYNIGQSISGMSDWSAKWAATPSGAVVKSGGDYGGRVLGQDEASKGTHGYVWDEFGEHRNSEVLTVGKATGISGTNNSYNRVYSRMSGSNANKEAYFLALKSGAFYLRKYYNSGSLTTLDKSGTTSPGTWYRMRMRVERDSSTDNTVKANFWEDGTGEPSGWKMEVTDSGSGVAEEGLIGLGSYDLNEQQFDFFSVGVGGASAPSPSKASAGGTGIIESNSNAVIQTTNSAVISTELTESVAGEASTDGSSNVTAVGTVTSTGPTATQLDNFENYTVGSNLVSNGDDWGRTDSFGAIEVGDTRAASGTQSLFQSGSSGFLAAQSNTISGVVSGQTTTFDNYPSANCTLRGVWYMSGGTCTEDLAFGIPSGSTDFNDDCYRVRGGTDTAPFLRRSENGTSTKLSEFNNSLNGGTWYDWAIEFEDDSANSNVELSLRIWEWDSGNSTWNELEASGITATDTNYAFPSSAGVGVAFNQDGISDWGAFDYLRYYESLGNNGEPNYQPN